MAAVSPGPAISWNNVTLGAPISSLRPLAGDQEKLRAAVRDRLDPEMPAGIVSMHLIEGDPALSRPLTSDPSAANPGAASTHNNNAEFTAE